VVTRPPMRAQRSSMWIAWALAALFAATSLSRLVPVCLDQLAAPFDLISEGPHMCTVKAIQAGSNIYDSRSFLDLPFFMTPYTPLYHVLVAALPQHPENPFFTGRVVAALFMVAAAATLLVVAGRGQRATAVIAVAAFFLIRSVTGDTAYLRSDSMALCWSAWAVVLAARARAPRAVLATGALCALAVAAKQSFLAAPVACAAYYLLTDRRRLGWLVLGGAVVGAACGLAAWAYWGNGFWLAVTIPVTDYPRDIESFFVHWHMMFVQPIFVFLLATATVVTAAAIARERGAALATPFFAYMLFSWTLQTWVMTGIGAENHNLIEPVLATLLWIVVVARRSRETVRIDWAWALAVAALGLCVALEMRNPDRFSYSYTTPAKTARYVRARTAVEGALRTLGVDHGRMLNLKNSQVVHDFAGEMAVNDVWMYITVLWNSRPETADRLIHAIEAEHFDAIFTSPGVVSAAHDPGQGPWARIIRAVFAHYALAYHGEEVNVLIRRRVGLAS
jgi:hypothetical protein